MNEEKKEFRVQTKEELQKEINENWVDQELEEINGNYNEEHFLPYLTLEEDKITEFEVDFSEPFKKYEDIVNSCIKKILPVIHNEERKVLFINVRNPLYREILEAGKNGQTKFKVFRTGKQANTRYNLVKG